MSNWMEMKLQEKANENVKKIKKKQAMEVFSLPAIKRSCLS